MKTDLLEKTDATCLGQDLEMDLNVPRPVLAHDAMYGLPHTIIKAACNFVCIVHSYSHSL